MSEKKEKTTTEVTKKDKKTDAPAKKKGNGLKGVGAKIKKFFKDFKGEWKKVTWPSGHTVLKNSLVVIAITAIVGVALFVVDTGLSSIIDLLVGLAKDSETTEMMNLFLLK
jgi:preprotein translocase subunit SecE